MTGTRTGHGAGYRHTQLLQALAEQGPSLGLIDAEASSGARVSTVRRARASLVARRAMETRELVLLDRDGVLSWQPTVDADRRFAARRGDRRRARRGPSLPDGAEEVVRIRMPVLGPNQYMQSLAQLDDRLNPDNALGLRRVVATPDGRLVPGAQVRGPFAGRTLLIVHGTFSSARSLVADVAETEDGARLLRAALDDRYDQVLCFDHATLSVSPFLNALDLAQQMGPTAGELDIIAHSRGGLVVQWWLEVLGAPLEAARALPRAFFAGSPLRGTSAAAPDKIHALVNLITNIGAALSAMATVGAATNPFATAAFGLTKLLGNALFDALAIPPVNDLGARGSLDAAVAVIPGLQGQSAVDNNAELLRLSRAKSTLEPLYAAVITNFETDHPGWKFWRNFRGDRLADTLTGTIFTEANDLVVDTAHMTVLGARGDIPRERVLRFPEKSGVWHCSYFSKRETIAAIREAFSEKRG